MKPMVPGEPLPQVLPTFRPMALPDPIPRLPYEPAPIQRLVNPRPLDIRFLSQVMVEMS